MKRVLLLALVFALLAPAPGEALTTRQTRAAVEAWADWMAGDTGEVGYFIGRCTRTRCRTRLTSTDFGDCTQTVYVKRKRRAKQDSEIVWRKKWVVGVTDAGSVCDL